MKRINLFVLFIVELFICFLQAVLFFILPVNSYREQDCSGKMLAYMPLFTFILFITTCINGLFFLIAFLLKNYKLKFYTFLILITTYSFIITTIIFYNFGSDIRSFELTATVIIFGSNTLAVIGYVKLYQRLLSSGKKSEV